MDAALGPGAPRPALVRLAVAGGAVVAGLYLALWAGLIASGASDAADYTAFYTGWTMVADGDGSRLYDVAAQTEAQRDVLGGRQFEAGLNPFNNPPHLVLPFLPLATLPLGLSYLVWAAIQVGLLAWLAYRLVTRVGAGWVRDERILLVVGLVAMPSLAITLLQGAFSLVAAVAVLEFYLALRAGRDVAAAAWLTLGSLKPQATLSFVVMLAFSRRWRCLGYLLGFGAALAVLATVVLGPGIWASYLSLLSTYMSTFDQLSVRPALMWNVRGTLTLMVGPDRAAGYASVINTAALIAQVAGLVAIAWIWRGAARRTPAGTAMRFALTTIIGLLASPHLNSHDGLLLVVAGAIAYGAARDRPGGGWFGIALLVAPFVILVTNPLSANDVSAPPIRVPVVLMAGLAVWMATFLHDLDRADATPGGARAVA
jgi:hypothetical protein